MTYSNLELNEAQQVLRAVRTFVFKPDYMLKSDYPDLWNNKHVLQTDII